jgi:shikimate kinase
MKNNIIYLAGFMGAGKSTIGPILANTLGWNFVDLDKFIELNYQKSITAIFQEDGEPYFREIETAALHKVSSNNNLIISLGGGTIAFNDNLIYMKNNGKIVYLKSSLESVYKRLKNKRDRPILLNDDGTAIPENEFLDKINALYQKRKIFYDQSDIIIDTDANNVGKTVDLLSRLILRHS